MFKIAKANLYWEDTYGKRTEEVEETIDFY